MIRSLLKTGGLFSGFSDGFVDASKDCLPAMVNTSMNNGHKMTTEDVNDLISCNETDIISSYANGETDLDDFLNGTDLNSMLECEEFTDFSDLLLDENEQAFHLDTEQFSETTPEVQKSTVIKRTAAEACPESVANLDLSVEHNYYVPLKKFCVESTDLAEVRADVIVNEVCDVDDKHMRYLERRRKNNAASKRSRETKKGRMADMEKQAVLIEESNVRLQERIVELNRLTKLMKSLLVEKVTVG